MPGRAIYLDSDIKRNEILDNLRLEIIALRETLAELVKLKAKELDRG